MKTIIMQVLIMQERLEEKDAEIERLKQDLHQNDISEEKNDLPPPDENNNSNNKVSGEDHDQQQQQQDEMISGEAEAENEKS